MFENQFSSLMLMQLLCFSGMLVMFLFVIRALSNQNTLLRESARQQQNALADMERQLMDISFMVRSNRAGIAQADDQPPAEVYNPSPITPEAASDILAILDPQTTTSNKIPLAPLDGLNFGMPQTQSKESNDNTLNIHLER